MSPPTRQQESNNGGIKPTPTKWKCGDFTLVSADDYEFKIDSCHLLAASQKRVDLMDDVIESSTVLNHFLTLITTGSLEEKFGQVGSWGKDTEQLFNLMSFMIKYDCKAWINALILHVYYLLDGDRLVPLSGFILGALIDRPDICVRSLKSKNYFWGTSEDTPRDIKGRTMTDPRALSIFWWRKIPADYLWALTNAWDAQDTLCGDATSQSSSHARVPVLPSMTEVADEFAQLLGSLKEESEDDEDDEEESDEEGEDHSEDGDGTDGGDDSDNSE